MGQNLLYLSFGGSFMFTLKPIKILSFLCLNGTYDFELTQPFSLLFYRVVCTYSKSWTSMLLPDCHFCGFVSLKQLLFLGFMEPVGLVKTLSKCLVTDQPFLFSGIIVGYFLLQWSWR